jgi:hypothetical protein
MELIFAPTGELVNDFGMKNIYIQLPAGAVLGDLLSKIDANFGRVLPAALWNRVDRRFRGPVVLMSDGIVVRGAESPLRNGQEIKAIKVKVGG